MKEKIHSLKIMLTVMFIILLGFRNVLPQTGFPQEEHPRIYLNDVVITELKSRMTADTPEWQYLQEYLNDYMADIPWGGEIIDGIATFALAYLITDNTSYADRAIFFIEEWMAEVNGTNPFYVSGDDYAHLYAAVGLGFDWLYNYPGFTAQQKEAMIQLMNQIYDYGQLPWDQGGGEFETDPRDSDQFIGGALTALIWGTATYGHNTNAEVMMARSRTLWDENVVNWILQSIGGVWPEGSQYSYNTLFLLMAFTEVERTANGIDYWNENSAIKSFIPNSINALIWLTPPSNDHIVTFNDQEDENSHYWDRRNHFMAIATFLSDYIGSTLTAAKGRFWIREISPNNIEQNLWKLFIWYDRNRPHTDYFNSSSPSVYFSDGLNWVFLRSNWTDQCTYSTFNASWTNVDHQFCDGGHFNIWRNGEYLTRGVRHYDFVFEINGKYQSYDGEASNIMLIESDYESDDRINAMGSPELFESFGEALVRKFRKNNDPLFTYTYADLGDSYNRIYDEWGGNSERVNYYVRQFIQVSPDFYFVYDRIKTVDQGWAKYILHSLTEPVVSGNLVTQISESGTQTLYNKTLYPETVTISKINEADIWNTSNGLLEDWMIPEQERNWHVIIQPENSDYINMMNVLETSDGGKSEISNASLITTPDCIGAVMGNWSTLFAKINTDIADDINYQYNSSNTLMYNLVCDLIPQQYFDVSVNGNLLQPIKTADDGTLFFTSESNSGLYQINITKNTTGVEIDEFSPSKFKLYNNYPNPFNPSTVIEYDVSENSLVKLKIYNVLGELVNEAVNKVQSPGKYKVTVNMKDEPSGIYIYNIEMSNYKNTKKMILLR